MTASLIPSVRALGPSEFKQRVRISNASWQIEDIVRRRLEHELRMAGLEPVTAYLPTFRTPTISATSQSRSEPRQPRRWVVLSKSDH